METIRPRSRRHALRLLAGAGLAAVPVVGRTRRAGALRGWCRCDPTVRIGGEVVHLYVSGRLDIADDVAGPTAVVFRVTPRTACELLDQDDGFGQGYDISFAEDEKLQAKRHKLAIAAEVCVPATAAGKGQPILVEWIPDGTVKRADSRLGKTNQWIVAATKTKRG